MPFLSGLGFSGGCKVAFFRTRSISDEESAERFVSASDRGIGGIGLLSDPVREHFEVVKRKRSGDHLPWSAADPCRNGFSPNRNELLHTPEQAGHGFNQRFDRDQHAS